MKRTDAQGIVKVFGIDRVNREGQGASKVPAAGNFKRIQGQWNLCSLGLNLGREDPGKSKLFHDGVNFGFVLAPIAQDFDHLTARSPLGIDPLHEFKHHELTLFCAA